MRDDLAVRVEHLGKSFQLGQTLGRSTLKEVVSHRFDRQARSTAARNRAAPPFWALRDLSFEVPVGEVLGIIGPNGAGKSTLLKILSRIVAPTTGRVEVRGRLGCLLEVGTGFHPELTGRENVFLNAAILGMSRAETEAKFDEIVAFSGIEPFIDTPVKRYSSGMYMRLAFSVAAHIEPDVLVIDEVLAVGDAAFQERCVGKMGDLVRDGRTVLFVSHQLAIVQKLCTRAIVLRDGALHADGPTREALAVYLRDMETWSDRDLATRTSRAGNGANRFQRIEVVGGGGLPPSVLAPGEKARFSFHLAGPARGGQCSFTIYDELGDAVTYFDTANGSDQDRSGTDPDVFSCDVDVLPLRPGRYRINAMLVAPTGEVEDHVEAAAVFDVAPGLLAGRPVEPASGHGQVAVPHRWLLP